MFGSHKVKIEGELLEKVKQCSDAAGYESIDEFVIREAAAKASGVPLDESPPPDITVRRLRTPPGYLGAVARRGRGWAVRATPWGATEPPPEASAAVAGLWDPVGSGRQAETKEVAARQASVSHDSGTSPGTSR